MQKCSLQIILENEKEHEQKSNLFARRIEEEKEFIKNKNRRGTHKRDENECKKKRGKEQKSFTYLLLEYANGFFRAFTSSSSPQNFALLLEYSERCVSEEVEKTQAAK